VLHSKKLQRRYAQFQLERGGSMLAVGERFLADGATGSTVAAALEGAGDEALRQRPELAEKLFAAAGTAGGAQHQLSARQAHAAALAGDGATALRLAEEVIADSARTAIDDRRRAVLVAAALLAQRGVPGRSTMLYTGEPGLAVMAVPLLIGAGGGGGVDRVRELLAESASPDATVPALNEAGRCVASALLASIGSGHSSASPSSASHTDALALLNTAITLTEPGGQTLVLPQTPAALCAVVATQCGEFDVAEAALRRAVTGKLGGRLAHPRHLLLHGWTSMLTGKLVAARRALSTVSARSAEPNQALQPADELLAAALQAGLARRDRGGVTANTAGMGEAWRRGRGALLSYPVDLYCLQQLGELAVAAAAAVGDLDGVTPYLQQAEVLLTNLGNPALWAVPLHWYRLQASLEISDRAQANHYARRLSQAQSTSPYAAALAVAAAAWLGITDSTGDGTGGDIGAGTAEIDTVLIDTVLHAAQRLGSVGLAAEGARLASHAAATVGHKDAAILLGCARALTGALVPVVVAPGTEPRTTVSAEPTTRPPHAPDGSTTLDSLSVPAVVSSGHDRILSVRELEVGRLILAGLTHKQIGEKLFISAKTVEHHVARIRQRLGVTSRTELFGRLSALISEPQQLAEPTPSNP
ncbi:MAG: response regulator transcription factor, partial [Mycobacteriales bacterium]